MSTGFATDASVGSSRREGSAGLLGERRQLEPGGLAGVGAEDPEPAGVRQHARRGVRCGTGWQESSAATSSRPDSVSARITPAWRKTASTAASEPGERRGVRAGRLLTRRASGRSSSRAPASRGRAGARCARTCVGCRTTRGRAGRDRCRRRPPTTRAGRSRRRRPCCRSRRRPTGRGRAPLRARAGRGRARPTARRSRSCPAGNARGANVAFMPTAEDAIPRQFGPTSRAPWARTRVSSCSWRSTPSGPVSAKPAEMTQSARVPVRSASSAASSTCSPGRQITHEVDRVGDLLDRRCTRGRRRPARPSG